MLHHKTIIFYLLPVDWLRGSILDSNVLIKIYDILYSSSSLLNAVLRHKKSFVLKDNGGNFQDSSQISSVIIHSSTQSGTCNNGEIFMSNIVMRGNITVNTCT